MTQQPVETTRRIRTMDEFATVSGISRPTLSRFFSDPQSVRKSSRAKIEQAMERFGYRPNLFAMNFNRRNPKTLGIVVPSLRDPFYTALVERIERQAAAAGYWSVVQNSHGEPDQEAEAIATLISLNVAGSVVVPLGFSSRPRIYRDMSEAMPLVFLDARAEAPGAFVATNNLQSIGVIVDYLLRSGEPPSYFDMPDVNQNARERREAYEAAMQKHGAEPRIFRLAAHDWAFERLGFEAAKRLFEDRVSIGETVLCANDRIAFGVMAAATEAGIRVGRTSALRIAGHDDHPLSCYACPSLTTVAQDIDQLATRTLAILVERISEGMNVESTHLLDAKLIMRASA